MWPSFANFYENLIFIFSIEFFGPALVVCKTSSQPSFSPTRIIELSLESCTWQRVLTAAFVLKNCMVWYFRFLSKIVKVLFHWPTKQKSGWIFTHLGTSEHVIKANYSKLSIDRMRISFWLLFTAKTFRSESICRNSLFANPFGIGTLMRLSPADAMSKCTDSISTDCMSDWGAPELRGVLIYSRPSSVRLSKSASLSPALSR